MKQCVKSYKNIPLAVIRKKGRRHVGVSYVRRGHGNGKGVRGVLLIEFFYAIKIYLVIFIL